LAGNSKFRREETVWEKRVWRRRREDSTIFRGTLGAPPLMRERLWRYLSHVFEENDS